VPRIRVDKQVLRPPASTDDEQAPATEEEGIPVRVFDLRREERVEVVDADEAPEDDLEVVDTRSIGPVLVLP
jgi:hypothetical protein